MPRRISEGCSLYPDPKPAHRACQVEIVGDEKSLSRRELDQKLLMEDAVRSLRSSYCLAANFHEWIHKERQFTNRVDEVGRTVPVSRLDGRTRGIEPARRGRLALPFISRWERGNWGGTLRVHQRGKSCELLYFPPSGRFAVICGSVANSRPFALQIEAGGT